jgi:hypothetical protein
MKNSILILCFIAFSATLFAQNPRVETFGNRQTETYQYIKGGDSIRFTIRGKKDTLQITHFFRSGKIETQIWKKDSCYEYDQMGRLSDKYYSFSDGRFDEKNSISFYANGRVHEQNSFKKNRGINTIYYTDGDLFKTTQTNYYQLGEYKQIKDGEGKLISSSRIDTLPNKNKTIDEEDEPSVLQFDTLFYEHGRPFKTSIKRNEGESLGSKYFNVDGSLAKIFPADSLKLTIFKDNVDCYYGLKNRHGDTIVKPKFDHIDDKKPNFWAAHSGNSVTLFKPDGSAMPIFTQNLSSIGQMWSFPYKNESRKIGEVPISVNMDLKKYMTTHYAFSDGNKYGVVTSEGMVVIPPQYFFISGEFIESGNFFQFHETKKNELFRTGFLNQAGKPLFTDRFKTVLYTYNNDYFFLCEKLLIKNFGSHSKERRESYIHSELFLNGKNLFGLGQSDGTVLLEPIFSSIRHIENTHLFRTTILKPRITDKKESKIANNDEEVFVDYSKTIQNEGIFDARSRRWLLDTIGFDIVDMSDIAPFYFIIKDIVHNKYGVMDSMGNYILPLAYDFIYKAENEELYVLEKGKNHQICTINDGKINMHPTKYDYLERMTFGTQSNDLLEPVHYFLAKQNSKWGVIDINENIIKPFDYDYASYGYGTEEGFILVKDSQAIFYKINSLPNAMPSYPHIAKIYRDSNDVGDYWFTGDNNKYFYINKTGKVVLPPPCKIIRSNNNYEVAINDKKQKKLIFLKTGKVIDYPFTYQIENTHINSSLILVKDSLDITYGVVSIDGKILAPTTNYGVAIGDIETSTFFVKRDTPIVNKYAKNGNNLIQVDSDTLNAEDSDWLMYNGDGKLLATLPFRFPINFKKGVGIGVQTDVFNLYKTDATILKPFTLNDKSKQTAEKRVYTEGSLQGYKNIRRLPNLEFYALFYNQGLTPLMVLTKNDGQILIESGRYDGISEFYDKFALVSHSKKIGLIDTFGREVIAPQDLRTYSGHFMDSLDLYNKSLYQENLKKNKYAYFKSIELPIHFNQDNTTKFNHPDSLKINPFQRTALWNLMLEQFTSVKTATNFAIPRVPIKSNAAFFSNYSRDNKTSFITPIRVALGDSTVSFVLLKRTYDYNNINTFHNFYRFNNRWEELQINDLLQIQGEKRWQINDLITKKVKALKDQQIDCSNASAFITTVENRWMLTKDGIDFCFDSSDNGREFVIISFTWAELAPFLKMKIF